MEIAVTATQKGMTDRQKASCRTLLESLKVKVMHNGWCVGGDEDFLRLADALAPQLEHIYLYPSTIKGKVSTYLPQFVSYVRYEPALPLERNREMVIRGVDGLIATPKEYQEVLRSGTWSTVRYARAPYVGRAVWIVKPDGDVLSLPRTRND